MAGNPDGANDGRGGVDPRDWNTATREVWPLARTRSTAFAPASVIRWPQRRLIPHRAQSSDLQTGDTHDTRSQVRSWTRVHHASTCDYGQRQHGRTLSACGVFDHHRLFPSAPARTASLAASTPPACSSGVVAA